MLGSATGNPLKRSRELSGLYINESESFDPPTKRNKTWLDHTIQSKSAYALTTATQIVYPLRKPRGVLQATKISFAPLPIRTEAGRAAGARLKVAMSNRRKTDQSNQLKLSERSGQSATPAVSLEATLSNTIAPCNPGVAITTLSAVDTTVFKIHEDTADEEMGNLLTHSANALDISNDETRIAAKMDRGKENVLPTDDNHAIASIGTATRAARMVITRTKPRTPLGSLSVADFYPQSYDVDSVIIVPAEPGY